MTESEAANQNISATAHIVASHLSHNTMTAAEVPSFIGAVYMAIERLGSGVAAEAAAPVDLVPAVPIKKSIGTDHLICLSCGVQMKTLKRHIWSTHGLTPAAYRSQWKLSGDYPLVAPSYAAERSRLAKEIGLGTGMRAAHGRRKANAEARA